MYIKVNRVNLGDCIEYYKKNNNCSDLLLVDCGCGRGKSSRIAYDAVKHLDDLTIKRFFRFKYELAITHFHSDHYNGLCKLR